MKLYLTRSLIILLALYGLLFAVGDVYLSHHGAPVWIALIFPIVLVGVQFLISPWLIEWILDIVWDDNKTELPARNREFVERLCAERGLQVPRIGVIFSGTPNAFSFGHTPADSRVVVTTGLLKVLTPEEANSVLAHEIGHVEHWDFVIMTVAALVPLLLYQLYAFTERINNARAVAYTAYICYWISQFIVLLLNRTREYFADQYACHVTQSPDALSSALVKIAYGMVQADGELREAMANGSKEDKNAARAARRLSGAIGLMGISNVHAGAALALGEADPVRSAAVMRWDLVNPWARLYELNSTHPLTALRVRALNEEAAAMHQAPRYPLPSDQQTHWGAFPLEFLLWATPWLCGAIVLSGLWFGSWLEARGIALPWDMGPFLVMCAGATWIVRTWFRYYGAFQPASIGQLLEDVEVSQMRPRAVRLEGAIVGRGVPGAFWSPDLVFRDATGIVFLLYRQSIPFARLWFALSGVDDLMGQKVMVEGWFRRGLRPYVEMSCVRKEDGSTHRAWSRWVQYIVAVLVILGGWWWRMMLAR